MADLGGNFDARNHGPMKSFEPLAAGEYAVVLAESNKEPNNESEGHHLKLVFMIVEGEAGIIGRRIFANLNLWNTNPEAVKMAEAELAAICNSVGVLAVQDSSQLHDIPLLAKVGLRKRRDTGEMANQILNYRAKESFTPPTERDSLSPQVVAAVERNKVGSPPAYIKP